VLSEDWARRCARPRSISSSSHGLTPSACITACVTGSLSSSAPAGLFPVILGVRDALAGRVKLALLDRSYAGLQLVEDGIANLCMLLPRAVVGRVGRDWQATSDYLAAEAPKLAERLIGAEPLWNKAIAVVCPTRGYLHHEDEPAVYRVGDRLAHIPPFTGDGIAIALGSAALAVEFIREDRAATVYLAAARQLTGKAIRLASIVSDLAVTRAGSWLLLSAAARAPELIRDIVRRTRLPSLSAITGQKGAEC